MTPGSIVELRGTMRLAQIAVALILAVRVYLTFTMPPIGDEAYYWMWGQKLAWSYFDHPPLHAWLLGLMSLVFGWSYFSLRVLTWVSLGGTLWIFWAWSRRLAPEAPARWFWPAAAIYLASPLFLFMGSIAFHDHLLIFLSFASAHLFLVFAEKWEASGRGFVWLYAAAAVLGLAVLTKYNGVLVGAGIAVFFLARRELRPLFRSPHLYLAVLLAVALQAPVLWWNITEGFASYRFHLSERWSGGYRVRLSTLIEFLAEAVVFISPMLFPAIGAMFFRRATSAWGERSRVLALCVFVVSTLAMGTLSLVAQTFFYWNITAFLLLMPLVAGWMRRRWVFVLHLLYGLVGLGLLVVNNTQIPIINLRGGMDWTIASTYGWPAVAARIEALRKEHPVGFVAAARYTTAAQLGFAMHDPDVTAIADRHDQYDYWFDPAAHEGQDALVVSDPQLGVKEIKRHFDTITELETVPYERFGRTIYKPKIYLATGFHAVATQ